MTTSQILSELFTVPLAELRVIQSAVAELARLRERAESAPSSLPAPSALLERSPMRTPKPGSLRADVHAVLKDATGPLKRSEVIARVAERRGATIDDHMRSTIGEILRNRHDPRVRRVGHGIYSFCAEKENA